jgi:hypothetical protein
MTGESLAIPEAIDDLIDLLKGPSYCESFDGDEIIRTCQHYVDIFMPSAMPVIGK